MSIFVALLRGVNVGGARCKMSDLEKGLVLSLNGLVSEVKTYLQSGNVVLSVSKSVASDSVSDLTTDLEEKISCAMYDLFGFQPSVIVLSLNEYEEMVKENPYPRECTENLKSVHMFVFPRSYSVKREFFVEADALKSSSEKYCFIHGNRVMFLHTPDGFGISKFAKKVEKIFQSSATARNWRSVNAILDLAKSMANVEEDGAQSSNIRKRKQVADSTKPKDLSDIKKQR